MIVIFADGFEIGNFSNWTGTSITGTTLEVSSLSPGAHHGTYYARVTGLGAVADDARIYKNLIPSYSTIYVRGYTRLEDLFTANTGTLANSIGVDLRNQTNGIILNTELNYDGTNYKWVVKVGYTGTLVRYFESGTSTVNADKWYCIEAKIIIDPTIGEFQLWVDGIEKLHKTNLNTSGRGNVDQVGFYTRLAEAEPSDRIVYFDCFKATDAYIGPEPKFSIYVPPGVTVSPYEIHRSGTEYTILRVDFHDEDDLPSGSYSVEFYVRDPNYNTLGPYIGTIVKKGSKEYYATYNLDPPDDWNLGLYDLKAMVIGK